MCPSLTIIANGYTSIVVVPGEPTDVKTENPGKRNITLWWGKPKLHGDAVRRYKVTFDFLYIEYL